MKKYNTVLKKYIFIITTFLCSLNCVFAENLTMERMDYTANYDEQISVDEELFEKDIYSSDDYDDYNIYSYEENEECENEIVLIIPEKSGIKNKTILKTGIEKNYTVNRIQAFNTYWDDSENFKTILRTNPSLLDTVPSLIQESYFRFNTDDNTQINWGHTALSSQNNLTVGFIDKLESSYESGMKISTTTERFNFSGAIYESQENHNVSGGIVFSTNTINLKNNKGSFILGGGIYATDYTNHYSNNTGGIFTKYNYGRFSLGLQIAQSKYFDNGEKYGTSCYFYPEYKINKSLTLTSGIASHFQENYAKEEIGLTYKPFNNNPNDFSVSLKATFYNGEGVANKQKIKLKTEFKL